MSTCDERTDGFGMRSTVRFGPGATGLIWPHLEGDVSGLRAGT